MAEDEPQDRYPLPDGLGVRGTGLWRDLEGATEQDGSARILIIEACRVADRLERLDEILRGDVDTWMQFKLPRAAADGPDDGELVLHIDNALMEARQQQGVLRQILGQLRRMAGGEQGKDKRGRVSDLDQLAAARAARRSRAATS